MVTFDEFKKFYYKFPDKTNSFYYKQFPKGNQSTIRSYKHRCKNNRSTHATDVATNNKSRNSSRNITKSIPPNTEFSQIPFIDDPDELLMSVAIRELNKPKPDPRWANVLITTRRENIGLSKKEGYIQSKFKSLSIKEVAKISSMKPTDISQKPDLKESS